MLSAIISSVFSYPALQLALQPVKAANICPVIPVIKAFVINLHFEKIFIIYSLTHS
jgi:hypothetical protein